MAVLRLLDHPSQLQFLNNQQHKPSQLFKLNLLPNNSQLHRLNLLLNSNQLLNLQHSSNQLLSNLPSLKFNQLPSKIQ